MITGQPVRHGQRRPREVVSHLRPRDGNVQPTTAVELLFDLVYVIAVTQLSHLVIRDGVTLVSVAQAAFLLVVVWWAWTYTTWMVNWFDPNSGVVRLVLMAGGLASLLMSAAIPDAFGPDALLFAVAYVTFQVGRNLAGARLLPREHGLRASFERLSVWSIAPAPLWILGGCVGAQPILFWGPAMAIELVAPAVGYVVPGRGRSLTADWTVEGGHFAERFQAFIIIALGESIAVTGTSVTGALRGLTLLALCVAFVQTGLLWWLYFGEVAEHSRRSLAEAEDPGRLARDAYTYGHLPIVAGIIMLAVAEHTLILHPGAVPGVAEVVMLVGGPVLYLGGESGFRLRMIGSISRRRAGTVLALAACAGLAPVLPTLGLSCVTSGCLALLVLAERPSRPGPAEERDDAAAGSTPA